MLPCPSGSEDPLLSATSPEYHRARALEKDPPAIDKMKEDEVTSSEEAYRADDRAEVVSVKGENINKKHKFNN